MLLKQIINTPRTTFTLVPNQNIGAWKVGFKPQLLMREYLTRRGAAKLRTDQYQASRCPLLGYELNYLTLEGSKIPSRFLKAYNQPLFFWLICYSKVTTQTIFHKTTTPLLVWF